MFDNVNTVTRGNGLLEVFLAKQRARKANNLISSKYRKGRILDIGCGFYPYFLLNTDFKEKYGVDPSIDKLLITNKSANLKKISVGKQKLPFTNNYFDTVTMLAVFEHIDNEKLNFVLNEIKRVLKKNGIFIVTTPAPWADKLLHVMAKIGLISSEEIHEHKHNHLRMRIEEIIENSGFDRAKIKSGYFEFHVNMWFIAQK